MSLILHKTHPRLWSIENGRWMVVSDLHGDGELYGRYRDRFLALRERDEVDGLIFLGDLVHREPDGQPDQSVEIVLDVIEMRKQFGDAVIYLCGNHETPHLYSYPLSRGNIEFTPPFEHAMNASGRRADIMHQLRSNPFYLRTAAA